MRLKNSSSFQILRPLPTAWPNRRPSPFFPLFCCTDFDDAGTFQPLLSGDRAVSDKDGDPAAPCPTPESLGFQRRRAPLSKSELLPGSGGGGERGREPVSDSEPEAVLADEEGEEDGLVSIEDQDDEAPRRGR